MKCGVWSWSLKCGAWSLELGDQILELETWVFTMPNEHVMHSVRQHLIGSATEGGVQRRFLECFCLLQSSLLQPCLLQSSLLPMVIGGSIGAGADEHNPCEKVLTAEPVTLPLLLTIALLVLRAFPIGESLPAALTRTPLSKHWIMMAASWCTKLCSHNTLAWWF